MLDFDGLLGHRYPRHIILWLGLGIAAVLLILATSLWYAFGRSDGGSGHNSASASPQNTASATIVRTPVASDPGSKPQSTSTVEQQLTPKATRTPPQSARTGGSQVEFSVGPTGHIVFASNRGNPGRESIGNHDIYTVKADGTNLQRITGEPGYDDQPVWSPDCRHIAFISDRTGTRQLWIMSANGADARQITSFPQGVGTPDWSPDGRTILFAGVLGNRSNIWAISPDGTHLRRLTRGTTPIIAPAWSPDGRKVAYMAQVDENWQVFVMRSDGAHQHQITFEPVDHRYPRWMPDGRRIIYSTLPTSKMPGEIFVMNSDGTNLRQITKNNEGDNMRPYPSPDGRYIVFNSDRHGDNFNIYIMRPDGSEVKQLTRTAGNDWQPAWSPEREMSSGE